MKTSQQPYPKREDRKIQELLERIRKQRSKMTIQPKKVSTA
jgi:hypothetical protein